MVALSLRITPILAALLLALTSASPAAGGWMGFRNDTSATLVIQENLSSSKVGQAQKVFRNETVRDTAARTGGKRTFTIYDAAKPEKAIYTGQFSVPADNENILFVLKSDGRGGIIVETIRHPATAAAKK